MIFLKRLALICLIFSYIDGFGQETNLPLNHDLYNYYEAELNKLNSDFHTSVKPYRIAEINKRTRDSLIQTFYFKDSLSRPKNIFYRKARTEHLLFIEKSDFSIYIDPTINFTAGKDIKSKEKFFTNSRGLTLSGSVGSNFSYTTTFHENQLKSPG